MPAYVKLKPKSERVSTVLSTPEQVAAYESIDWKNIDTWEESLRRGNIDWLREPVTQEHLDELQKIRKEVRGKKLSIRQLDKLQYIDRLDDVTPKQRANAIKRFVLRDKPFPKYTAPTGARARAIPQNRQPGDFDKMDKIYRDAAIRGQAVDHGEAIMGKHNSPRYGLYRDVPDNMQGMDPRLNLDKSNKIPDDFDQWQYKEDPKTGRVDAYRMVDGELQKVPRWQGGFVDPGAMAEGLDESPRLKGLLKGAGKIGLLGAAEMGLNYFAPDNPINQARQRGHDVLTDLGVDLRGAIDGIDHTGLKVAAMLGEGLFVDPLVTAFGAGNWLGDRIQQEWRGEKATNNLSRGGYGMMGRFNKKGIL